MDKAALLDDNLRLLWWSVEHQMSRDERQALGDDEDAFQSVALVFLDAVDVAERKGLTIATATTKLLRYRMRELTARSRLIRLPRNRNRNQDAAEAAAKVIHQGVPDAFRNDPAFAALDDAEERVVMLKHVRALDFRLRLFVGLRFGLHGKRRLLKELAPLFRVAPQTLRKWERKALAQLRFALTVEEGA